MVEDGEMAGRKGQVTHDDSCVITASFLICALFMLPVTRLVRERYRELAELAQHTHTHTNMSVIQFEVNLNLNEAEAVNY